MTLLVVYSISSVALEYQKVKIGGGQTHLCNKKTIKSIRALSAKLEQSPRHKQNGPPVGQNLALGRVTFILWPTCSFLFHVSHTTLFQKIPYFEVLFHFISKTPPHPPPHPRTGNLKIPCFGSKFSSAALRAAKTSIYERFRQMYGLIFQTSKASRAVQRV